MNKTIRELRYNLGQAYQDGGRQVEAYEIFAELHSADPSEQRFAVKLFTACQALGKIDEMRRITGDLDSSPVADYLNAQVWIAEKRYAEALSALERIAGGPLLRPALFLEIADLHRRLGHEGDARKVYERALALDPDDAAAYVGLGRMALRRRKYSHAARFALQALERVYTDPQAHFLLGRALSGMREYERAADAFRAAISFNPHFPEAHTWLAELLEKHTSEDAEASEHRRLAREMRGGGGSTNRVQIVESTLVEPETHRDQLAAPLSESLIVVTGLPRSGTSMLMQMLAAGGVPVVTDASRKADEDNPRGYLEFEPVKKLANGSEWLDGARGKAIKIIAPLLFSLPPRIPLRVILCERNMDEVLDSQERMLVRRNQPYPATPEHRRMLKAEYGRTLARVRALPDTPLLAIDYAEAVADPRLVARKLNSFLGGGFDADRMAEAVDPALHRNRALTY